MVPMTRQQSLLVLGSILLASCGTPSDLEVRPMHLRNLEIADENEPMIRGEQRRLLHGAIGVREQEQRLGHYYTVLWNNEEVGEPVRVKLEYQQGSTGSAVKSQVREFDGSLSEGRAVFEINGDDYLKNGRVLAWRCSLWRGGREVSHRQSYLWE